MTFKSENPRPGDFGLVHVDGFTGKLISTGQRIVGSGSYFTHAFLVVENGDVVQAQPGGAERVSLSEALNGRTRVAYSDFALTDAQRAEIVSVALSLVGTPYSFVDYAAIGAYRLTPFHWFEDFVSSDGHLICSQLVEEAYMKAGLLLFPRRPTGDVAPGDLARLIGA